MDNMTGMDIAQVRQLSSAIRSKAQDVRSLVDRLTGAIDAVDWRGPDREHFVTEWRNVHASALRGMASAMDEASGAASASARAQEEASR